jgi:hypothetical protein
VFDLSQDGIALVTFTNAVFRSELSHVTDALIPAIGRHCSLLHWSHRRGWRAQTVTDRNENTEPAEGGKHLELPWFYNDLHSSPPIGREVEVHARAMGELKRAFDAVTLASDEAERRQEAVHVEQLAHLVSGPTLIRSREIDIRLTGFEHFTAQVFGRVFHLEVSIG